MTSDWPRRVLVIGTGAMAALVGARLAASGGVRVTLVGTWRAALDAIARNGIAVHDDTGMWTIRVGVRGLPTAPGAAGPWSDGTADTADMDGPPGTADTDGPPGTADTDGLPGAAAAAGSTANDDAREVIAGIEPDSADLVVVLVKSVRTSAVATHAARALAPDGIVLTLQNGLGNGEALAAAVGAGRVAVGVTAVGAHLLAPGVVADGGVGPTVIGPFAVAGRGSGPTEAVPGVRADWGIEPTMIGTGVGAGRGASPTGIAVVTGRGAGRGAGPTSDVDSAGLALRLASVASVFTAAGMPTEVLLDVRAALWRKLAANCAINPLAALLGVPNGALVEDAPGRAILVAAAREVGEVAARLGIALGGDPGELALDVARQTAANRCSMLQDLQRGAPTEIEAINGAIVAEGRRLGVETPVNAALVELVRAAEAGRQARSSTPAAPRVLAVAAGAAGDGWMHEPRAIADDTGRPGAGSSADTGLRRAGRTGPDQEWER